MIEIIVIIIIENKHILRDHILLSLVLKPNIARNSQEMAIDPTTTK